MAACKSRGVSGKIKEYYQEIFCSVCDHRSPAVAGGTAEGARFIRQNQQAFDVQFTPANGFVRLVSFAHPRNSDLLIADLYFSDREIAETGAKS